MRSLMLKGLLVALLLAFAGCAEDAPVTSEETGPAPSETATETTTTEPSPEPTESEPTEEETTNETAEEPEPAPELVILHEETFSGSLPAPDPEATVSANHQLSVPDGAKKMDLTFSRTYTGMWGAVLSVSDPDGEERATSLDSCENGEAGANMENTCSLRISGGLSAGDWTLQVTWQLGEVTETYDIDATVWGLEA